MITYLYKVVDGFQVEQVVITNINTEAEVEACVAAVHNLEVAELEGQQVW